MMYTMLDAQVNYYTTSAAECNFLIKCINKTYDNAMDTDREFLTSREIPVVNAMKMLPPKLRSKILIALYSRRDLQLESRSRVVCPECDAPLEQGYESDGPHLSCTEITRCSKDSSHYERCRQIRFAPPKERVINDSSEEECIDVDNINDLPDWEVKRLFSNDVY